MSHICKIINKAPNDCFLASSECKMDECGDFSSGNADTEMLNDMMGLISTQGDGDTKSKSSAIQKGSHNQFCPSNSKKSYRHTLWMDTINPSTTEKSTQIRLTTKQSDMPSLTNIRKDISIDLQPWKHLRSEGIYRNTPAEQFYKKENAFASKIQSLSATSLVQQSASGSQNSNEIHRRDQFQLDNESSTSGRTLDKPCKNNATQNMGGASASHSNTKTLGAFPRLDALLDLAPSQSQTQYQGYCHRKSLSKTAAFPQKQPKQRKVLTHEKLPNIYAVVAESNQSNADCEIAVPVKLPLIPGIGKRSKEITNDCRKCDKEHDVSGKKRRKPRQRTTQQRSIKTVADHLSQEYSNRCSSSESYFPESRSSSCCS